MKKRLVLGAAVGQCVHIAGLDHFLRLCEEEGWEAISLGPAVPVHLLIERAKEIAPEMVAVSYRLTAEDADPLLDEMRLGAEVSGLKTRWVFGGTPPAAKLAREKGFFERTFDGTETPQEVASFVRGVGCENRETKFPSDLVSRIEWASPFPLFRHHYGEPDVPRTVEGAKRIAESGVLDVLSIGPDQNAQEHFFRPQEMDPSQDGAGGVPLRRPSDLKAIYDATRCGNHPLVRCYSGTRDLVPWAEMSLKTINIAWGAIPLCWYSAMDGRSKVALPEAIREKQAAMRWYAERDIPLEVNESHQWSLRDAHDSLAVAMAFLAAYNAKVQGARTYIIQMMHNTPPSTSPSMDLAKMLAKLELIRGIEGPSFRTIREVRAGITSLPPDPDAAKGHMAASAVYSMALDPQILHVVGFSEASRVVDPATLIESCRIARGAVRLSIQGAPDPSGDCRVQMRRDHLVREARVLLEGIGRLGAGSSDPWADADVIDLAVRKGVLDTPHFRGNPNLCGKIVTANMGGGWEAINPETRKVICETERLSALGV